jgi:drug/metabolite transporter (DMT)-like permease
MALALGSLGVLLFSFSLPATKLAVDGLDPTVVGLGRAVVAAALGAALLAITRQPRPTRAQLPRLGIVAFGVVIGFPWLTAIALTHLNASHGAVVIALLPAGTAIFAVTQAGERPSAGFWAAAGAALVAVLVFTAGRSGGLPAGADWLLLVAVVVCSLAYAEGGALGRELGGWQTICWALLLALPVTLTGTVIAALTGDVSAGGSAWFGFAYVAVISMFLAFFAWYAGLALGGVAKIGQVQHAQPVLSLLWAGLFLHETIGIGTEVAAAAVLACVVATQRARVEHASGPALGLTPPLRPEAGP